ncbi:MAG TPA: heavy metal translocating P-type ATPase [Chthoniobacterales bacterium]|nr:heavy metal translocating P-type ATPase [Chthoniobacterales bacterium]
MIFSLAVNLSPPDGYARMILHTALAVSAMVVFLLVGLPLWHAAMGAARRGRITFEQLFLAGIFGAFAASVQSSLTGTGHVYYEIVSILLAIYTFGRILGERRRHAAMDAARAFGQEFDLAERVSADGGIVSLPVREIRAVDIIHVAAGGGIPIDGIVIEGKALVNEATLTGEPAPVARHPGDFVLAGSRSLDAPLRLRATVAGVDRQIDGLLARVRAAQQNPSHLEREADRIVAWFLSAVFGIAALTFTFWTIHSGWTVGLFNALAVVLVACPCSMGLATPIGIWSAIADLARHGLIAGSSDLIERLGSIEAAVFDKTGTLSGDELELVEFQCEPGVDRELLLAEVAAVEAASQHPIARAFRRQASGTIAEDVSVLPGQGIAGRVNGAILQIGNASLLGRAPTEDGSSFTYVLRNGALAGTARLREHLRDHAAEVIAGLEEAGIPCAVFTGDRLEAASALGLGQVRAGLSPLEKATHLQDLSHRALFVGDGINDAAAMAEAHASLTLVTGSGVAREIAMGELRDLRAIPFAVARSRAAVKAIRQNLIFAAAYNFVGIGLAASGVLHPVAAALLMLASSFTVSYRALRNPTTRQSFPIAKLDLRDSCGNALTRLPQPT